jgi:16S rRNA (cytosine967-C5)-methyltransferase
VNRSVSKAVGRRRNSVSPARLAAFEILRRVNTGGYASVLLASRAESLEPKDRALCHELVLGVLRYQLWLDYSIEYFAGRPIASLDLPVKLALRLGLYQLRFLSRIPPSAAVNESVNLVRYARVSSADSLVNAVLRRASREPEFDPAAAIEDPFERLAVSTSHPRWLIERWVNAFGSEETEALALANNQPAPIAFRVVRPETSSEILAQLRATGATLEASQIAEDAWRLQGGGQLAQELARAGKIYFQDEASQMVAQMLDVQPGDRVLDVCAAPGSKTSQIAATSVSVVAADIHQHRIETVKQALRTQGLANVSCVVLDGESGLPFEGGTFERVLVDAPCSGTGTLRHNPEIRWRISAADIKELADCQLRILSNASLVVKPGGRLIYSTCSLERDENEAVITDFLDRTRNFEPVRLKVKESLRTSAGTARTWPHRDDTDGFFVAGFSRKA